MRKILAVCAFAFVTNVYADTYKCEFDGGKLSIDSINKKFTLNNQSYDIEGVATNNGKKTFLGSYLARYTKPITKDNQNIRYMWAINKESKTFFVIVNAENFKTIKIIPAQCDPQKTPTDIDSNFNPMSYQDSFINIKREYQDYLLKAKNKQDLNFRLNRIYEEQEHDRILANGPLGAKIVGGALGIITDLFFWLYFWIGLYVFNKCIKTKKRIWAFIFAIAVHTALHPLFYHLDRIL